MAGLSLEDLQSVSVLHELKKRKQVEDDACKLRNRLLKLERQAHQAEKRIVQTKQRAKDILDQRDRNEQRHRSRQHMEAEMHLEIQQHRQDIAKIKNEARRNRFENEARLFQEKLALVQETRTEKREIERQLADQRLLDRRAALEKKEEVRRALGSHGSAKELEEARKRKLAQAGHAEKVLQEVEQRRELERELKRMASLEVDLIDRLRDRQLEQHQAYSQLQAALNLGKIRPASKQRAASPTAAPPLLRPARIREVFEGFSDDVSDSSDTCSMEADKLEALLQALGVFLDEPQLSTAAVQLDLDRTGRIDLAAFVAWMQG